MNSLATYSSSWLKIKFDNNEIQTDDLYQGKCLAAKLDVPYNMAIENKPRADSCGKNLVMNGQKGDLRGERQQIFKSHA